MGAPWQPGTYAIAELNIRRPSARAAFDFGACRRRWALIHHRYRLSTDDKLDKARSGRLYRVAQRHYELLEIVFELCRPAAAHDAITRDGLSINFDAIKTPDMHAERC